jgi:hypothetical protein
MKGMKYFLITLLACIGLFQIPSFSQPLYLNQIYDFDSTNDWGYSVFAQADGNYFVIGGAHKTQINKWRLIAKRIAPNGTELLTKAVLSSQTYSFFEGSPGAIKRLVDGSYIVPISKVRPGTYPTRNIGLAKLNSEGDIIWLKYYTDTSLYREYLHDLQVMPDGGFLLSGFRDSTTRRAMLIRTDSSGNVAWQKIHSTCAEFENCVLRTDGTIVGCGLIYVPKTTPPPQSISYVAKQPFFAIFDAAGNLIRDTLFSPRFGGGGRASKDVQGGVIHYGVLDTLITSNALNDENFPSYVALLDTNCGVQWVKPYIDFKWRKSIYNVVQLHDNNFLVLGIYGGALGWATKIDRNGFTMWENYYLNEPDTTWAPTLVAAVERNDHNIVMTGTTQNDSDPFTLGQDVWVVVIDSMGCIVPNCAPTTVKEVEPSLGFLVSPNPLNGLFNVEVLEPGTFKMFDVQGREVMRSSIKIGRNELGLSNQARQGIYIGQFVSASGRTASLKLVVNP